MNNLIFLIIVFLNIQIFACKSQSFEKNQRILRELSQGQDTCLYVLLDAGSSSTKIRLYSSVCRQTSQIPQLKALTPLGQDGKALFADKIQISGKNVALTAVNLQEADFTNYFNVAFQIISDMKQFYKFDIQPFLFLRATAGLRLLTQDQQESILNLVRVVFRKQSSFYFLDDSWARVITGEEEGLFLWLSVNYAYQNIKHQSIQQFDIQNTAAVIDIGGASAQIAFHSSSTNNKLLDLPEKTRVQIYSHTILGYGNDQSILGMANYASCFQKTDGFTVKLNNQNNVQVDVNGNYDFVQCTNTMLNFMGITGCQYKQDGSVQNCSSFSQIQQLTGQKQIIGASSIYFSKLSLSQKFQSINDTFTLKDFRQLVQQFCSMTLTNADYQADQRSFTNCIQMMWVSTFLIDGLGLLNNSVTSIQQYNSFSVDWSLGSLIFDINTMQCDYLDVNQCNIIQVGQTNTYNHSIIINSLFSIIILFLINLLI
ncbi:GDA1/CD39 nucleoside phosphatase family protein (macronuclear) [Tetrahymena thermophila SB210]|uniref:GDA1/CD39 nucleoside phosphatase family protein n=1 Tax=Tetrahymena thermophila (strain SB210) TaxID=312017 RepID=I7MIQ8_TETTS|nr:GDA1/CD39 nucleoside phosphatase family protein [Tetrahymena thermophila SB210]EAS04665.2 GDA1/CD39 nucleoside phosphatase family protein [Tetrahymena thermophila SB210]|eukprot:XP_001024910.2 GDA1/CD39 nucleoside phosphatase family protein [Tetrahymena thermophila SB210]